MCRRKETGEALMVGPFQTTWQYSCVRWEWGRQTQTEAEWCVGTRGAGSFTRIGEIAHKIRTKLNFDLSQSNIKLFYGKKKKLWKGRCSFSFFVSWLPLGHLQTLWCIRWRSDKVSYGIASKGRNFSKCQLGQRCQLCPSMEVNADIQMHSCKFLQARD